MMSNYSILDVIISCLYLYVAPDAEVLARKGDDRLFKSILLDPKHVLRKHFSETIGLQGIIYALERTSSNSLLRMTYFLRIHVGTRSHYND